MEYQVTKLSLDEINNKVIMVVEAPLDEYLKTVALDINQVSAKATAI